VSLVFISQHLLGNYPAASTPRAIGYLPLYAMASIEAEPAYSGQPQRELYSIGSTSRRCGNSRSIDSHRSIPTYRIQPTHLRASYNLLTTKATMLDLQLVPASTTTRVKGLNKTICGTADHRSGKHRRAHHLHQHQRKSGITGNTTIMADSLQGLQPPSLPQHKTTNRGSRQSLSPHEETEQQIRAMDPTGKNQRYNRGRAQECQSRNNTTKSGTTGSITGVPEHHRSASAQQIYNSGSLGSQEHTSPHKFNKEVDRLPPSGLSDCTTLKAGKLSSVV
jgi:hypothetical protein